MPSRRQPVIERNCTENPGTDVAGFRHGRVPRALRKQQILAAAEALFIERGYAQASMDTLARRVGVSKPVIYDLVGSKEQLFAELVASEARALAVEVERAVNEAPERDARLYAGALAFFRFAEQRREAWDVLYTAESGPVSTELRDVRRFHARAIAALLADAARDVGRAVDPMTLEAAAHSINGSFEALASWWKDHPDIAAEQLAQLATALVAPGLKGLLEVRPLSKS